MTSPVLWTLIAFQLAMGLFDILYHHELTERLAWRPSQQDELKLHGARNLLYAVLFIVLGWFEPHGVWAIALIVTLAAEIVITLLDFVEEDVSRKLPWTERVLHTLLALNYGAILALLVPVLVAWATQPTDIIAANNVAANVLATIGAGGVAVFALRDFVAFRRAPSLVLSDATSLVAALPARQHVLITGATGFVGRRLVDALAGAGHEVIVLARDPARAVRLRPPFRLVTSLDQIASETRIDAVINLAGEPIANALWTQRKRRLILSSRLRVTRAVVALVRRLERRPSVLISASAIGWYGAWGDEELTEFDGGKRCFGHRVCEAWEQAARKAERLGVRVVRLRIGLVLGTEDGMLNQLLTPFEFGLGGPMGSGRQWMSWIERDDLVRLIAHIAATPKLTGAVNGTAPVPARNATFAQELARALHRPARLRMPAFVLRFAGELANELILTGRRVLPDKALGSGFQFRHETLPSALAAMLGPRPAPATRVAAAALPLVPAQAQRHNTGGEISVGGAAFAPSPLRGEGRGEGVTAYR
jgi:uncharacterized protein